MEEDAALEDHESAIVIATPPGDLRAALAAVAAKEPFLIPICRHLSELITMGRGNSHSAARLLEYIIESRPAEEADSWRNLLV
jgi:hypothetical protein